MDLRFLKQPRAKVAGETATARVTSFLQSIYESVAETLPDIRDDGVITSLTVGAEVLQDEYAESLSEDGRKALAAKLALTAGPGSRKKARKRKFGLELHLERHPDCPSSTQEVRFLPPGVMRDYWEMMRGMDQTKGVEFPHLRFRPASLHSQCASCLHHKLLIRELSGHMAARVYT